MKVRKSIAIMIISIFTVNLTSCVLLPPNPRIMVHKKDNGKHKGWYKNPKNPHHPASKKPGHKHHHR